MESGLEDRNNRVYRRAVVTSFDEVSMEPGLEDRNNDQQSARLGIGIEWSQWSPA